MAQNIHLKDRVRFLPTHKKADLPPMFDCNFVATTMFTSLNFKAPEDYDGWQSGLFNFNDVIGIDGSGAISQLDQYAWQQGATYGDYLLVINPAVENQYPLRYNSYTLPNGSHSGFLFYTVYDVEPLIISVEGTPQPIYKMSIDIWESKVLINNATNYSQIN
jgi:hypothetical protein